MRAGARKGAATGTTSFGPALCAGRAGCAAAGSRLRAPMARAGVDLQLRAPAAAAVALRDDTAINDPHNEAVGKPLAQINLVTNDMAAAVEFYRRLGWEFEVTPDGAHAATQIAPGVRVELDTGKFASVWNAGAVVAPGGTLLIASMDTRVEVDTVFAGIVNMGHAVVQRPHDAFWGARFATVADPDGHQIGLMSPTDERSVSAASAGDLIRGR